MVRKGQAFKSLVTSDILASVTGDTLTELFSKELNMSVAEGEIDRTDLYATEEVFLCGSGAYYMQVIPLLFD
jgi:branched-chain amino acid aminotransferase